MLQDNMAHQDHADVKIIPPLVPLFFIGLGWVLNRYVYVLPIPLSKSIQVIVAYVAMCLATVLFSFSLYYFFKTKQNPEPHTPTNDLYTSGIYRITRNPIYLGFVVAQIVVAIKFDNLYILLFIPLVIVFLNQWVIKAEESYLKQQFGQSYVDYQKKVRRWL